MKIKQLANCSIAIRSIGKDIRDENGLIVEVRHEPEFLNENGHPINYEFLQGTVHEVNEDTGNHLLAMKLYSDGTITDPEGNLIPKGVLCSDFVEVE